MRPRSGLQNALQYCGCRAERCRKIAINRQITPFCSGNDLRLNDIRSVRLRPDVALKLLRRDGSAVSGNSIGVFADCGFRCPSSLSMHTESAAPMPTTYPV
jgi:hypothetical protein